MLEGYKPLSTEVTYRYLHGEIDCLNPDYVEGVDSPQSKYSDKYFQTIQKCSYGPKNIQRYMQALQDSETKFTKRLVYGNIGKNPNSMFRFCVEVWSGLFIDTVNPVNFIEECEIGKLHTGNNHLMLTHLDLKHNMRLLNRHFFATRQEATQHLSKAINIFEYALKHRKKLSKLSDLECWDRSIDKMKAFLNQPEDMRSFLLRKLEEGGSYIPRFKSGIPFSNGLLKMFYKLQVKRAKKLLKTTPLDAIPVYYREPLWPAKQFSIPFAYDIPPNSLVWLTDPKFAALYYVTKDSGLTEFWEVPGVRKAYKELNVFDPYQTYRGEVPVTELLVKKPNSAVSEVQP